MGWVVSATPRQLYPQERDLVSIVKGRIMGVYAIEGGELDELEEPTNI
jgi:hypothetical protein